MTKIIQLQTRCWILLSWAGTVGEYRILLASRLPSSMKCLRVLTGWIFSPYLVLFLVSLFHVICFFLLRHHGDKVNPGGGQTYSYQEHSPSHRCLLLRKDGLIAVSEMPMYGMPCHATYIPFHHIVSVVAASFCLAEGRFSTVVVECTLT